MCIYVHASDTYIQATSEWVTKTHLAFEQVCTVANANTHVHIYSQTYTLRGPHSWPSNTHTSSRIQCLHLMSNFDERFSYQNLHRKVCEDFFKLIQKLLALHTYKFICLHACTFKFMFLFVASHKMCAELPFADAKAPCLVNRYINLLSNIHVKTREKTSSCGSGGFSPSAFTHVVCIYTCEYVNIHTCIPAFCPNPDGTCRNATWCTPLCRSRWVCPSCALYTAPSTPCKHPDVCMCMCVRESPLCFIQMCTYTHV